MLISALVVAALVGGWWWTGVSNPLPDLRSEVDGFVPPDGSELVVVEEYGFERVCLFVCSVPTVVAKFALPDLPVGERCASAEQAMIEWLGAAESAPGRGAVACAIDIARWPENPSWDPAALVFETPTQDGSDLWVYLSKP